MSRLAQFFAELEKAVRDMASPAVRRELVQMQARAVLAEAEAMNRQETGSVPPHETIVDGRVGASLDTVNPDRGEIVFRFKLIGEVLSWIDQQLIAHSPVDTGAFRKSHTLFADGAQASEFAKPPPARQYVICSVLPYARKLETRTGGGEGLYQGVAVLAATRFGNMAEIHFDFHALAPTAAASVLRAQIAASDGVGPKEARRRASRLIKRERASRQPAIFVTPR